ncbi:MAG: Rieske 2Fe-2S domain-containing protein [Kiritimatiellia bacterium]|jgi:Rieske Fe-S protein|nr:Rieske 2Fe-2S domain-containing protein [Kiritimatiellia bacterium]
MNKMTRRDVVAAIGVAGTGVCVCGMNQGCATFTKKGKTPAIAAEAYRIEGNTVRVALDKVPALAAVCGAVKVIDPRLPTSIIIARKTEDEYVAASLLCPHRGVEVEYQPEQHQFRCASLGHSKFGEDGTLKKGLAKKGLTRYEAKLDPADKNRLLVTF